MANYTRHRHRFCFMKMPPDSLQNKKTLAPTNLGQELLTPAVPPEFIRIIRIHFLCAHMMHTSLITGEVPVAPRTALPPSVCPHKPIQHSRRCRNHTIYGSLGTPETMSTLLTRRFSYVVIYCMRCFLICQGVCR